MKGKARGGRIKIRNVNRSAERIFIYRVLRCKKKGMVDLWHKILNVIAKD
jgi:hypothetical protein